MIPTERDIDQIAEYADASVRSVTRRGSLAPIAGRHGFNAWLYRRWGNRGNAVYTFTGGLLTIALSGGLAWALEEPLDPQRDFERPGDADEGRHADASLFRPRDRLFDHPIRDLGIEFRRDDREVHRATLIGPASA